MVSFGGRGKSSFSEKILRKQKTWYYGRDHPPGRSVERSMEARVGQRKGLSLALVEATLEEVDLLLLVLLHLFDGGRLDAVVLAALGALLRGTLEDLDVERVLVLGLGVVRGAVGDLVARAVLAVVVLEGLAVGADDAVNLTGGHFVKVLVFFVGLKIGSNKVQKL